MMKIIDLWGKMMEMIPRRKQGRPRVVPETSCSEINRDISKEVTTSAVDSNSIKIQQLEQEKAELQRTLEKYEDEKKGISTEQLAKRTILTPKQVEELKLRISSCDKVLSGQNQVVSTHDWGTLVNRNDMVEDREEVKKDKLKAQRILAQGKQPELSERDVVGLKKRKEELDTYLKQRMSAVGDEWDRTDPYEFNKTILNKVKYEEECGTMETELKNINKILNPEDPMAGNLGYLNPKTRRNS
jgi:hypothetical protein